MFPQKVDKNLKLIYIHRSILILASSFFGIFGIIFLYTLFNESLIKLTLFSLASSLGYLISLPFLQKIISLRGFPKMILIGTFFNTILLSSYLVTSYFELNWGWILILISLILLRTTYWVPMHTEMAESSNTNNRGSMLATIRIITNTIGIASPIISGFVVATYGFYSIFFIGALISIVAIVPLFKLKDKEKKHIDWDHKKVFQEFKNKKNRNFILALFSMGIENSVAIIVWPIFIYELLKGDFLKIGALSAAVTFFVIILNFAQGKFGNKEKWRKKMMKFGTWSYSFGWFLRIFATTATYIFIIDVYQRMAKGFSFVSFDAFVYDYMSDQGNLVDEYTILREIALHAGKIVGFIIIIIASLYVPINYLFLLAVFATLAMNILPTQKDAHGNNIM